MHSSDALSCFSPERCRACRWSAPGGACALAAQLDLALLSPPAPTPPAFMRPLDLAEA